MATKGATRKGVSKGTKKGSTARPKTAVTAVQDPARPLPNPLHERFACEYLRSRFNATVAYQATYPGVKPDAAQACGSRLLSDAMVRARVEHLSREALAGEAVTAMQIVQGFARVAALDPARAFGLDGNLLPIPEMPDDVRLAIAGMEVTVNAKGERTKKIKFNDRIAALTGLAKVLKLDGDTPPPAGAVNESLAAEEARRTAVLERIARLGERLMGSKRDPITVG